MSIGLRPGRWEAAASLGVLAFCAAFLLVQRLWGWVDESTGALPLAGGDAARFLALGVLVAALWLVDLRLPEKVRRWLGLGLLLLLPLGAFFLVDHINGYRYNGESTWHGAPLPTRTVSLVLGEEYLNVSFNHMGVWRENEDGTTTVYSSYSWMDYFEPLVHY